MAITERYVTATGTDTYANSTNPSTPMSLATAIANSTAGDRINIKSGTYTRTATDTIARAGTTTSPIIWRGYATTIGDATAKRGSGGALNVSNMPVLAYNATFRVNVTAAHNVFEALVITANSSSSALAGAADTHVVNCKITQSSTNGSALALSLSTRGTAVNCDLIMNGASGGNCVVSGNSGSILIYGCLITAVSCVCVSLGSSGTIVHSVIHGTSNDGIQCVSGAACTITNCTIYNVGGDGIDIAASVTTGLRVTGCHITNCGAWGINFNGATTPALIFGNRFRDNTSGNVSGAADWISVCGFFTETTDTGGASTDFTNPGTDFSLIAGSPGISAAPAYLIDAGAFGTPVVTGGGRLGYGFAH